VDGNINLASGVKALIIFFVPISPTVLISFSFCAASDFTYATSVIPARCMTTSEFFTKSVIKSLSRISP